MKTITPQPLDQALENVLRSTRQCFVNSRQRPAIRELVYCGLVFLSEATKAACGQRPKSSKRLASNVAAGSSSRLRQYRLELQEN
jgi:hypothetical protein